jgi:hypothetical protein
MVNLIGIYFKLAKLIEDIDYFKKYPSRMYLRNFIDREITIEGKVRTMLNDDLIQREIFPNWITERHNIDDPLRYYLDLHNKAADIRA